jgi:rhodanese-related sulfurtransferase
MASYQDVPVTDYQRLVDRGAFLVDVREPIEVADGMLPGAVNIPLGEVPDACRDLDPSRSVALVCRSGGRSARAAELLIAAGFTDVVNLAGGMLAWDDQQAGSQPGPHRR